MSLRDPRQIVTAFTDEVDPVACLKLWQAILCAKCIGAVEDALECLDGTRPKSHGCGQSGMRVPAGWIGSRDFHAVCSLTDIDGPALLARLREVVASPGGCKAFLAAVRPGQGVRRPDGAAVLPARMTRRQRQRQVAA